MSDDLTWARKRMERRRQDAAAPQRRLAGRELREAMRTVRWLHPDECAARLELASKAGGVGAPMRIARTTSKVIVQPWSKPEVAAKARARAGEINKAKAAAAKRPDPRRNPEREEEMVRLYRSGLSLAEVGEKLGLHRSVVQRNLARAEEEMGEKIRRPPRNHRAA